MFVLKRMHILPGLVLVALGLWSLTFDTWIHAYLKQADLNNDGKMSYEEVQTLLQMINIDLSEQYARNLFKVSTHTHAHKHPLK